MATDAVDFRAAVGTLFNTGWAGATPIAWPGRDFEPPADLASFVRMTIIESDSRQIEIGHTTNQYREVGLIIFQIFTETDQGDGLALTLADNVANIFRSQQVTYTDGRAIFRAPQRRVIGPNSDGVSSSAGNWFQVNVSIPYIRDNIA